MRDFLAMDEHIQARLTEVIEFWNQAEGATKKVELFNGQVLEACINELRYAGRWIVLALKAIINSESHVDRFTTVEDALAFARLCCMQAKHDAVDALVIFFHERVDDIEERYTRRVIHIYINNYGELCARIAEIDAVVVESREHRENRLEYYDDILKNHIPAIEGFFHAINGAQDLMNEEIERERLQVEADEQRHEEVVSRLNLQLTGAQGEATSNGKKFWWSFAINIILALVSIGLGIVALK